MTFSETRFPLFGVMLLRVRKRPAGRPIEQLDGMNDRNQDSARNLGDTADASRRHDLRRGFGDVFDLAREEARGDVRLQHVVGAGRAAAKMTLGYVANDKPGLGEQLLRLTVDLLAVLHRTGRMVGDLDVADGDRR